MYTVKPLNNGRIGGKAIVHCREVVPISEVGWPATPLNPEVVNLIQRGVASEQLNQQSRADTLNGQKSTKQGVDRLSEYRSSKV